jgi:hypothetical protein
MDDPRCQQFFCEPHSTQQRRYEAIRAVVIEGRSPQAIAARFGFAYGTLRNLVVQFHADIRQGRTPPFSPTYERGVRLTKTAFAPIARRLIRSQTLPKWSLTVQPE